MRLLVLLLGLLVLAPTGANAAGCTVNAGQMNFGNYLPFSDTPIHVGGSVKVTCVSWTGTYTIALNAGLNGGGNPMNRRLFNGSYYLSYQLYSDSGYTTVWGDGSGGTSIVSDTCPPNCSTPHTIRGLIPRKQLPPAGGYSDNITVTVAF